LETRYAWAARDANGNALKGGKNYKLPLPPNTPVKRFWSIIHWSNQTRSMIQTDERFPSVSSQDKDLIVNSDGPVDVYFGPKTPLARRAIGFRPSPARAGTPFCGCIAL